MQRDKSKSQEALSLYQQTINVAPSNFGIPYEMMGDIYMQNKMKDKGIEDYKKAVELDDYCIMAHYSLYQYYISTKDTAEAQKQIDKIMKYSPDMLK